MSEAFERAVTALRDYAAAYAAGEGCDELPDRAWCATMVRAVLEAIREPDAAMVLAAAALEGRDLTEAYQAMLDEVLRDG